jgi:hypothetical protein
VHRFCLAAASEYFKSKLDRWTASIDAPSNMEIVEICEPDEVEAASAVVKVIYHGKVCDHPPAMQAVQVSSGAPGAVKTIQAGVKFKPSPASILCAFPQFHSTWQQRAEAVP